MGKAGRKPTAAKPKTAAPEAEGSGANLEKIRDILFGAQSRDFDQRLGQTDRLMREATDKLRSELDRRIGKLEEYVKAELKTLLDRLKGEQSERMAALKDAGRELKETAQGLERKLMALTDKLTESERALREQAREQAEALEGQISVRHEDGQAALERTAAELRHSKVDRTALSALFAELALHLGGVEES